jgi:hypothetical protein
MAHTYRRLDHVRHGDLVGWDKAVKGLPNGSRLTTHDGISQTRYNQTVKESARVARRNEDRRAVRDIE